MNPSGDRFYKKDPPNRFPRDAGRPQQHNSRKLSDFKKKINKNFFAKKPGYFATP